MIAQPAGFLQRIKKLLPPRVHSKYISVRTICVVAILVVGLVLVASCIFPLTSPTVEPTIELPYEVLHPSVVDVSTLVEAIRNATRRVTGGLDAPEFTGTARDLWYQKNPCKSREQLPQLWKETLQNRKWEEVFKEYSKLHRECTQRIGTVANMSEYFLSQRNDSACKFLVGGIPPKAGLGNKVLSMISGLLYAILTQRVFLVPAETLVPGIMCEPFEGSSWLFDPEEKSPTPPPHHVPPTPKVDPEACKAAGNKFFKARDYDRAVQEYTKAVDAEPSNPTYLSNRAAAYISANKYSQALGDSLQASRLDPGNDKILHRLARIYTSLGRPQDALDTYARIPDASAADTAAATKALRSINTAEKQLEDESGNGNMALWSIDQAKQTLGPGTPMPRSWQILRAKANLKIGSVNALGEVQAISQALMRENSNDAEAIVLAGRAFYLKDDKPRQGKSDYERAEIYLRQALSQDPDNSDARNTLRTMKKLERARNEANDAFKRGKYAEAVNLYTDALKIDPTNKVTNAKLLGNRALSKIRTKEYDEARADCDLALKLDPTYTKAKKTRAKATGESGDWEQAVKDLKALAEENPGDVEFAKDLRNAELELKKSKRKDYYKILGVDKDAGDKDIERAYKKKAAILHPDKTGGDEEKEAQFKDCLEAKETLLDPQKRHMYDSGADLMEPGMAGGGFPGGMGGFGGGMNGIDPEMLFNMMGGGARGGGGFPGSAGFPGGGFSFNTAGGHGGRPGGFPF